MNITPPKILFAFLLLLVISNTIFLNVYLFQVLPAEAIRKEAISKLQTTNPEASKWECDASCEAVIALKVDQALATFSAKAAPTSTPIASKVTPSPKRTLESYIPLGTGSTQNDQWEDIAGSDGFIDTNSYPPIKTVYFEAALHIPTKNGKVSARLFNVTDKHPVWNSEVSTENDSATFLGSPPIQLDTGNKQYRVQMKTSLKYASILSVARVKIISEY